MRRRICTPDIRYRMRQLMSVAETVRALIATGMKQQEIADLCDTDQPTISRWLHGAEPQGVNRDKLFALATERGVKPRNGDGRAAQALLKRSPHPDRQNAAAPEVGGKIAVWGTAEGGDEGWSLWNGEIVEYIDRPPQLSGAPKGYAVYVTGTSMEPRYSPGEILYINPAKPVMAGSWVLVQARPSAEGEAPRAVIARLVRKTPTKYVFEKLNPQKQVEIPIKETASVHKIVGSGE